MKKLIAGFTLIELVMVIVVLSLVSAGLVQVLGQVSRGLRNNNDSQIAIQLAQECGEYLIGLRRNLGYSMNGINNCDLLPLFGSNLVRPAVIEAVVTSSVEAYCPDSCKRYAITSTYGTSSAQVTLLLVSY